METGCILATIGLPWLGGVCVWLIGDRRSGLQHGVAAAFAVAAGMASLGLFVGVSSEPAISLPLGAFLGTLTFVADGPGALLAAIAAIIGSLTVIFSVDYMRGEAQLGRYYALVLYFIGAMAGLVLSGSLLFLFVFWEITAFCSYALISFHNDDPKAVAGGIKALIMTQVGGVGLLAAALLAYGATGDYQISSFLAAAPSLSPALLAGMAFACLAAAAAKSAQVPFHTWLPDAMEAPTPVSALIHAATMVNAGVYLLARFYPAFARVEGWTTAVIIVGLLSALLAAVMALTSNDLKRVLAYSTISQLGYMTYAVGVGAITAGLFHLLSHAIFKALLFLCAGAIIHAVATRDMRQMGGLSQRMPLVRDAFIVGALALAGLPVTNGFFSKELVLEGGLAGGPLWAFLGMLLGVGLTALYAARMVALVFFGPQAGREAAHDAPAAMRVSLVVLGLGTLTSWLLVGPFTTWLAESLPFHELESARTWTLVGEVLAAPATWGAILVALIGIGCWLDRRRFALIRHFLEPFAGIAGADFGFERINRAAIRVAWSLSAAAARTQTGQLNWNAAGIVAGLAILLAILLWRAP